MLMSLGEMPGIRDACPTVAGSMRCNFWRASVESWCSVL